jgi:hypothetical protein
VSRITGGWGLEDYGFLVLNCIYSTVSIRTKGKSTFTNVSKGASLCVFDRMHHITPS